MLHNAQKITKKLTRNNKHIKRHSHIRCPSHTKQEYLISKGPKNTIKTKYFNASFTTIIKQTSLFNSNEETPANGGKHLNVKVIPTLSDKEEYDKKEYDRIEYLNMNNKEIKSARLSYLCDTNLVFQNSDCQTLYNDGVNYYAGVYNKRDEYEIIKWPNTCVVNIDIKYESDMMMDGTSFIEWEPTDYYQDILRRVDLKTTNKLGEIVRECIGGNNNVVDTEYLDDRHITIIKPYENLLSNLQCRLKSELFQKREYDLLDYELGCGPIWGNCDPYCGSSLRLFDVEWFIRKKCSIQMSLVYKPEPLCMYVYEHSINEAVVRIARKVKEIQTSAPSAYSKVYSNYLMKGATSLVDYPFRLFDFETRPSTKDLTLPRA